MDTGETTDTFIGDTSRCSCIYFLSTRCEIHYMHRTGEQYHIMAIVLTLGMVSMLLEQQVPVGKNTKKNPPNKTQGN